MDHPAYPLTITGLGLISPLGDGAWPTFRALRAGKTLASRLDPHVTDRVAQAQALGHVACVRHTRTDPIVLLAERAAREALTMAGVTDPIDTVIGTSKGAVVRPLTARGPCGELNHALQRRMPELRVRHHLVAACASGLIALHRAAAWMPQAPRVLVVSAEAALTPLFIHSYDRLGVLAPPEDYTARPLDLRRAGFQLAEVGAAVVLERRPPRPGELALLGSGEACEAWDLLRPAPGPPAMPALRHVLQPLLERHAPQVIHAHAPGTLDHDALELSVYDELMPGADVYANKGAMGHTLGASGLVSLVLACLCAKAGQRPPMPWLTQPIHPQLSAPAMPCRGAHAVVAAGFAGHVAAAVVAQEM